jgi:hypothetical protein
MPATIMPGTAHTVGLLFLAAITTVPAALLEGTGPEAPPLPMTESVALPPGDHLLVDTVALIDFNTTPMSTLVERLLALRDIETTGVPRFEPLPAFRPFVGQSISDIRTYMAAFPNDPELAFQLAGRLIVNRNLDTALTELQRGVALAPDHERLHDLYLGVLVVQKRLDEAVAFSRTALERFPFNPIIRFNTACAHAQRGELQEALHHLTYLARMEWDELPRHLGDPDLDPIRTTSAFRLFEDMLIEQTRSRILHPKPMEKPAP